MIEWFKNHGWLPTTAAILILLGAPVAARVSPKTLRDLDIVQLSPTQLIGFIMVLIGVIFSAGALADDSKTSAKTLAAAETSSAEALEKAGKASAEAMRRRESYEKIRTVLDQHFALNEGDKNYYVSRVRRSAKKLRDEMNEISGSATETGERALARLISLQAGIFVRQLELLNDLRELILICGMKLRKSNYRNTVSHYT